MNNNTENETNQTSPPQANLPQTKDEETNYLAIEAKAIRKAAHLHFHLKFMWVFICVVVVGLAGLIVWVIQNNNKTRATEFAVLTDAKNGWTLGNKGIVARNETYKNFMLNVHRIHGVKHSTGKIRTYGLESKEVGVWIDLHWDCSIIFHFNPYEVPVVQISESSIDPFVPGPKGEIPGLAQMLPETADNIDSIIKRWDPGRQGALKRICKKYNLKYETFLEGDPRIYMLNFKYATVGQYIIMRNLADELDNNRMWYISCYHWGFLRQFYYEGEGILPTYFKVKGREPYAVAGYWCDFMTVLETFNDGKLEPAKIVIENWEAERKRMLVEERRFIKSIKTIKKQDAAFKKVKESELQLKKDIKDMEVITEKTYKELQQLIPKIRNFNGKDIRVVLNKYKGPVRRWVKAKTNQPLSEVIKWWVIAIIILALSITIGAGGIWFWTKKIVNGFSHSKLKNWYDIKVRKRRETYEGNVKR